MLDNWPVKHQGERATCVAFALAACRELRDYRIAREADGPRGSPDDLSEQYLYWATKQIDGSPHQHGTRIRSGVQALQDRGVCRGSLWAYTKKRPDGAHDVTHAGPGLPSAGHHADAAARRSAGFATGGAADQVRNALNAHHAVAVAMKVFLLRDEDGELMPYLSETGSPVPASNWMNEHTRKSGRLVDPFIESTLGYSPLSMGHAVCVFGYREDKSAPGEGWFLFRNSYGTHWTQPFALDDETYPAGYGYVSAKYVDRHCATMGVITGDVNHK
jgi:hypothetical protein